MKVFRFMSNEEFNKYKRGETLFNNTVHKCKTNSVGFCFLNMDEYTPEGAMHFLSGNVSFDICAVFETNAELNKTYGIYAKPIAPTGNVLNDLINLLYGYKDTFRANEYCKEVYNKESMKLIKYSKNIGEQWNPLEKQKSLKWEVL